jgi:hypothetical protein
MARHFGTQHQPDESESIKYPGFLVRPNGIFRKPFVWTNPKGKVRHGNYYFVERQCSACGLSHLVERCNDRKQETYSCSPECRSKIQSNPEGSRKLKRGSKSRNSYVVIRVSNHPHADRTGHVPEHRLVMEKLIGRLLMRQENVHHLNYVKSDNRPTNLLLCRNFREHLFVHSSLNRCVAALLESGALWFDKESMTYRVKNP